MRLSTKVWLGIHDIGNSKSEPVVNEVSVREAALQISQWLATHTLNKRIEIIIGRDADSVQLKRNRNEPKENLESDILSMFANLDEEESNDE